jgi:hypothetical protein
MPASGTSDLPSSATSWRRQTAPLLLCAIVAISALMPESSSAQGFFDFFRSFGHRDRTPAPRSEPYAYADPSEVPPGMAPRPSAPSEPSGRSTYCVRLCDGRFFPIAGSAAASRANAATMCSALCPASKTAVFRGGKIDDAAASNGDRYADLANAFVYRSKIVDGCTCNGKDALGLARIDIAADPTLKAGDVVATAEGLKVFAGGKGERHKSADFTPVENAGKLSAELRRHFATTRVRATP